jgi:bifunctional non-homologous end joining protein LigD
MNFGADCAPSSRAPVSSLAYRARLKSRRRASAGFTRSSTTAFEYWLVVIRVGVRLLTRNGNDFTEHFPHIAEAIRALNVRSCVIDGEAIVTDDKGLAVFELIRGHGTRRGAELCAFDLIELDGKDIRHTPIEERKRHLGKLLGRYQPGIVVNEFFEGDAQIIFDHVCKLGCEGIVSKRLGSRYRVGRSADWVKVKNPATGGTAAR